jgi:hypothetical protein
MRVAFNCEGPGSLASFAVVGGLTALMTLALSFS